MTINPAYTSQRCHQCGHTAKKNRESQAVFRCVNCGYTDNADINAARNILAADGEVEGVRVVFTLGRYDWCSITLSRTLAWEVRVGYAHRDTDDPRFWWSGGAVSKRDAMKQVIGVVRAVNP